MQMTACAFTGHRPSRFPWKDNEEDPGCTALKKVLAEQIEALAEAGAAEFFTGGAEGVDTWAAEAVLALREKKPALRLHCILPCEGQADTWSGPARERRRAILERADTVRYVSREYREGCLLERNRRLVDSAGVLLAVFNGMRRSGTGATVNYARRTGREILIIHPASLRITREAPTANMCREGGKG